MRLKDVIFGLQISEMERELYSFAGNKKGIPTLIEKFKLFCWLGAPGLGMGEKRHRNKETYDSLSAVS